jgi:hypothetical protein
MKNNLQDMIIAMIIGAVFFGLMLVVFAIIFSIAILLGSGSWGFLGSTI